MRATRSRIPKIAIATGTETTCWAVTRGLNGTETRTMTMAETIGRGSSEAATEAADADKNRITHRRTDKRNEIEPVSFTVSFRS